MSEQRIIMNYSIAPSSDDLEVVASAVLDNLPDELMDFCNKLSVSIEDFPDNSAMQEADIDDPYDLLTLYRSGKEISPGVEKKVAGGNDALIIFRRPLLDMWCESGDDLAVIIRQVVIEELGRNFNFSDDDIDEMNQRHY